MIVELKKFDGDDSLWCRIDDVVQWLADNNGRVKDKNQRQAIQSIIDALKATKIEWTEP